MQTFKNPQRKHVPASSFSEELPAASAVEGIAVSESKPEPEPEPEPKPGLTKPTMKRSLPEGHTKRKKAQENGFVAKPDVVDGAERKPPAAKEPILKNISFANDAIPKLSGTSQSNLILEEFLLPALDSKRYAGALHWINRGKGVFRINLFLKKKGARTGEANVIAQVRHHHSLQQEEGHWVSSLLKHWLISLVVWF